ncbi:MAG: four helix bundle protein [Bacteroidota bacterium]
MNQSTQERNQLYEYAVKFALEVREFGKLLPMTVANVEDLKQLIRASGAIGVSYISAQSSSNRTEYLLGIKKCVMESKSTHYWLRLVDSQGAGELEKRRSQLMQAAQELATVFGKIIQTSKVT